MKSLVEEMNKVIIIIIIIIIIVQKGGKFDVCQKS